MKTQLCRKLFRLVLIVCPFIVVVMLLVLTSKHSYPNFMEDNDLWKEDHLYRRLNTSMTEEMFNKIVKAGLDVYTPVAKTHKEKLKINALWEDSTVNANCSRSFFGGVTINMYGGMARRPEISPEGFALVMCHEIGHAYGGTPYIHETLSMSAEGQADYYGAKDCLNKILPKIWETLNLEKTPTEFSLAKCYESHSDNIENYSMCVRQLYAGERLGELLAVVKEQETPSYETPDPYITPKTLLSYPATVQCRQDTYFNGTLGMNRPLCWYKQSDEEVLILE